MRSQSEFSLVTINGLMHHYLDEHWIVMGQSRIGIYHDTTINTFRIVGRKIDDYEVVANCAINESFCYNKATPTFHQWRDIIDDRVYGVKFTNIDDANLFGETIEKIVDSAEKMAKMILQASNNNNNNNNNGNDHNGIVNNGQQQQTEFLKRFQQLNISPSITTNNNNNNSNGCSDEIDHSVNQSTRNHNGTTSDSSNNVNGHSDNVIQVHSYYGSKAQNGSSNGSIQPPPPPPPPPLPPHNNNKPIGPKPKISVKPEILLNGIRNNNNNNNNTMTMQQQQQQQSSRPSTMNIPNVTSVSNNVNNNANNKSNLIDEMAQRLAKRRAKLEESCQQQDQINDNSTPTQPSSTSLNNNNNNSTIKCYTPVNSTIRRFNSVSNGSSINNHQQQQYLNGGSAINLKSVNQNENNYNNSAKSSSLNMINQKMNSQSLINISNNVKSSTNINNNNNNNHNNNNNNNVNYHQSSPPSSISTLSSSIPQQNQSDRLKEEILQEIRQELLQFKQDLLNAIRVEILSNLSK